LTEERLSDGGSRDEEDRGPAVDLTPLHQSDTTTAEPIPTRVVSTYKNVYVATDRLERRERTS
jgi:hypothetical protein